jgi:adenine phosphoribosyltransferase
MTLPFMTRHRPRRRHRKPRVHPRGAVADRIGAGFIPVRKRKLPSACVRESYNLEYGTDTVEIHADAVGKGESVLLVDDLIATGGTAEAALVRRLGGQVHSLAFLIELLALNGRAKLGNERIFSVLHIDRPEPTNG